MIYVSGTAGMLLRLHLRIRPFVTGSFLALSINSFVSVTCYLGFVKSVVSVFTLISQSILVLSILRVEFRSW